MKTKLFCMMVLCTGLLVGCEKEEEYEPVKPPIEQPEEPEEPEQPEEPEKPTAPPSTDDIINVKIGDSNMIVGSDNWNAVTYGNGKYVAVGKGGYIAYSSNGENWTPIKAGYTEFITITYTNGKFIAIGGSGLGGQLVHSVDCINWASVNSPMGNNGSMKSIAYGDGKYCLIGTSGQMHTSVDLKSWSKVTNYNVERRSWFGIAYGNGKFVAVGTLNDGSQSIMTSENGIDWSIITGYAIGSKIIFENNKFIIFYKNSTVYYSTDGNKWENSSISSFVFKSVSYANGKFVALGENGYVTYSENLIDWATPTQITDEEGSVITVILNGICAVH